MFFNDGGYSANQFNTTLLRKTAKRIAAHLPKRMEATGAQAVAVTGKSGISLAFATLMLIDFPIIVVRKRGENSHGNPVEGTPDVDVGKYLILDDFVSSGQTVRNIVELIEEVSYGRATQPRCVGVIQYTRERVEEWSLNSLYVGSEVYEVKMTGVGT